MDHPVYTCVSLIGFILAEKYSNGKAIFGLKTVADNICDHFMFSHFFCWVTTGDAFSDVCKDCEFLHC